jgi:hypothetical protein
VKHDYTPSFSLFLNIFTEDVVDYIGRFSVSGLQCVFDQMLKFGYRNY